MAVPPTSLTRSELRAVVRAARSRFVAGLTPETREALQAALVEHLRPLLAGRRLVAGYAALRDEIDPASLGFDCWPRVGADGEPLSFHRVDAAALEASPGWGIREPRADSPQVRPDAILVPLLAVDTLGNRLGFGKGHYDRTLPLYAALRIGIAWDMQVIDHINAEAWDVPLDWLVTPTRVIDCRAATGVVGGAPLSR